MIIKTIMKIICFLSVISAFFFLLVNQGLVKASIKNTVCQKKYSFCYKTMSPNPYALHYFHKLDDWCIKFIAKEDLSHKLVNEEIDEYKCNIVDDVFRFKGKEARDVGIYATSQQKNLFYNTLEYLADGMNNLDKKKWFRFNSVNLLPENFNSIKDFQQYIHHVQTQEKNPQYLQIADNLLSFQKIARNKLFSMKVFAYIPQTEPYVAFLRKGYVEFQNVYKFNSQQEQKNHSMSQKIGYHNQYSIEEFEQYLQDDGEMNSQQIQDIYHKINKYITYALHSQYQDLQEKAKFFHVYEIDIVFKNIKEWEPVVYNVQYRNIMEDMSVFGNNEQGKPRMRHTFLKNFTEEVFDFQTKIIENFTGYQQLYGLFKNTTFVGQKSENLKEIINEARTFSYINNDIRTFKHKKVRKTVMNAMFDRQKLFCYLDYTEKTTPFLQYLEKYQKGKWVLVNKNSYWPNYHKCDIIYTSEYYIGGLGVFNVDYEDTIWNFTPQVANMHNKAFFFQLLEQYSLENKYTFNHTAFYPETYVWNYTNIKYTQSELDFINLENQEQDSDLWIVKPTTSSRGKGISIHNSYSDALKEYKDRKKDVILYFNPADQLYKTNDHTSKVTQRYIRNTQLLEKKKYDIRCYLLFAWTEPGAELVFYHRGYARRSMVDYIENEDKITASDLLKHLTNAALQQKDSTAKMGNNTIVSIESLKQYWMEHKGLDRSKVDSIFREVKKALTFTAHAYMNILSKKVGYFQFFGMDIMFDKDWKPYILEANSSPQVNLDTPHLKYIIPEFAKATMDLELFLTENRKNAKELIKEYTQLPVENLELLVNKANGFDYLEDFKVDQDGESQSNQDLKEQQQQKETVEDGQQQQEQQQLEQEDEVKENQEQQLDEQLQEQEQDQDEQQQEEEQKSEEQEDRDQKSEEQEEEFKLEEFQQQSDEEEEQQSDGEQQKSQEQSDGEQGNQSEQVEEVQQEEEFQEEEVEDDNSKNEQRKIDL